MWPRQRPFAFTPVQQRVPEPIFDRTAGAGRVNSQGFQLLLSYNERLSRINLYAPAQT